LSPASTTSNVSFRDHRMSDFANYRRDLAVLETSGGRVPQIQHNPPTGGSFSLSSLAPWMSSNGGSTPSSANPTGTSFYNDSSDNLSIASQLSPGFRSGNNRGGNNSGSQDSPDAAYFDERRPSLASITTASSQGSKTSATRGGLRKLQGFFGEEFPGRDGSDASQPPAPPAKDQRSRSYSNSRPHRDRNYSNATDHGRDASPSSSRPRTPVPAPEVVPFLYQEADVSFFFFFGGGGGSDLTFPLPCYLQVEQSRYSFPYRTMKMRQHRMPSREAFFSFFLGHILRKSSPIQMK
jgi:adenylate cyclase